jgi:glycosyltransferase involved in cell wall biosynthesis
MKPILLLIKVPPPITGATLMNQLVRDSSLLNKEFNIETINISYNNNVKDLGKINYLKYSLFMKYLFFLTYKILLFKPSLIYFQISTTGSALYRDIVFALLCKLFQKRILFHLHGKGFASFAEKNAFKKWLLIKTFKKEKMICLSPLAQDDIEEYYFDTPYIVANGIKIIEDHLIKERNQVNNPPILLYYSNFSKSKGLPLFINSLRLLKNENVKYRALIVGRECDLSLKDVEEMILVNDLKNEVKIFLDPDGYNKYEFFNQADIFIFTTQFEAFGIVVLEAMQFSLPVIASDEGSLPLMIDDGITGFLFKKNDPEKLALKIEELIFDNKLILELGKNGRNKFLSEYTYEIFENNIHNVFKDVLSSINK